MPIEELLLSDKVMLTPEEASVALDSSPQTIRMAAHDGTLGFPVSIFGSRVKIPRIPLLRFLGLLEGPLNG